VNSFRVRASSLGQIMTDPRSIAPHLLTEEIEAIMRKKVRTDEDKLVLQHCYDLSLSAGAITFLDTVAKEYVYDYHEVITGKYMEKGLVVEDESIALYNRVHFTNYVKNTERRTNEWLTGECDIYTGTKIIDIKSSWSLSTFPAIAASGLDKDYEWQLRAYMMLWDVDEGEIAYCMVSTPEELIRYEQRDIHEVERIDEHKRVTRVQILRDRALEEKIKRRVGAARLYLDAQVKQIHLEHPH
jgi:hypothetical protein